MGFLLVILSKSLGSQRVVGTMRFLGFMLFFLLSLDWRTAVSALHSEVSALGAFKRAINDDPHSVLSDWNTLDRDPCSWSGITCSKPQNWVISLKLSNSSLRGFLAPELGLFNSLQELALDNNLFMGTIPKQIGKLKNLMVLDLSGNQLLGPIPHEIGALTSITKINLHSNGLTGTIPSEFGNLHSLIELRLDRNKLTGPIPGSNNSTFAPTMPGVLASQNNGSGLCRSYQLKVADFSYNFLVGKIPPCLNFLPRSSFQGNYFQDKDSIFPCTTEQCSSVRRQEIEEDTNKSSDEELKNHKSRQPKWLVILEIITGTLVGIFLIICTASALRKCKPKSSVIIPWKRTIINWKGEISVTNDDKLLKNVLRLSRHELEVACEDFSNIIGSSPDSTVYKGTMENGPEIAVIALCISEDSWTSYLEVYFQNEVADLAKLNHENTAKLLGYCEVAEPFSRMLVFEYASNGTLYEHLHYGDRCHLSWLRRMKIAVGIAHGLRYLHTELQPPFTISELNSSAVYLTEDFSPKLVDFERWRTIHSKTLNSGCFISGGSYHSFVDSIERRHVDIQENTFAFGVLLLELISGRPPYCKDRGYLVAWATQYLQHPEKIGELVDPELKDIKPDDLSVICGVVSLCIDSKTCRRPSMQIICAMLEDGIDTSATAHLKDSSLAWAELALSS